MGLTYPAIARSIAEVRKTSSSHSPLVLARIAIDLLYSPQSIVKRHALVAERLKISLAGGEPSISWVGAIYEHALASSSLNRSHRGVFYTPAAVVEGLLDLTLGPIVERARAASDPESALLAIRIADPACGTGNFVFAAANRIAAAIAEVSGKRVREVLPRVLAQCIRGMDIDRSAIAIAREIAQAQGATGNCGFEVGDSLKKFASGQGNGEKFDLVIGNPPFLNQLRTPTMRSRAVAHAIAKRFSGLSLAYADTAFLFLLGGVSLCKPGGTLSMVQPISLLAARDAGAIRTGLLSKAALKNVWFANEALFSAGVRVCAPVLVVGESSRDTSIFRGTDFSPLGSISIPADAPTWGSVLAPAAARIAEKLAGSRVMGEIATCTADFRDEYYALKGCISEAKGRAGKRRMMCVITSGTIDLAHNMWGQVPVRIHKRQYLKPVANLAKIKGDSTAKRRLEKRCSAKVMIATQTRVIEVVIDDAGECLPVTPVITLTPREGWGECERERLFMIAAAAASPVACLWAVAHFGGAGLSIDAIKLSAAQVRLIPLPRDVEAWSSAASVFSVAQGHEDRDEMLKLFARLMVRMYGLSDADAAETLKWWLERAQLAE